MRPSATILSSLVVACSMFGCGADHSNDIDFTASGTTSTGTSTTAANEATGDSSSSGSGDESPIFDVGTRVDVGGSDQCTDQSGEGAPGDCEEDALPGSFEPEVEWTWGIAGQDFAWATPLVGNMTDDDDDGVITLCDVPDVVVMTGKQYLPFNDYSVTVLDGGSGTQHWTYAGQFRGSVNPAIGDIDGDDEMEVIAARHVGLSDFQLVALETDGSLKWEEPLLQVTGVISQGSAVELADLDNDGDVEIVAFRRALDHEGQLVASFPLDDPEPANYSWMFPLTVDLDGDQDLEVVVNGRAYEHDGTLMWDIGVDEVAQMSAVADFDGDGEPEIVFSTYFGQTYLVEHDGSVTWSAPLDIRGGTTVIDIDAVPPLEFAGSTGLTFKVSAADGTMLWEQPVVDGSGISSGTAFDFLGDATPDVIYGDEDQLRVWDSTGASLFTAPRGSGTLYEYPTVADVDNDGSADVVVPSNTGTSPPVQVVRDQQDRWVRARRIYNQYNYRITNVSEDGKIPTVEPRNWDTFNNFRVQAQISADGSECIPPEG